MIVLVPLVFVALALAAEHKASAPVLVSCPDLRYKEGVCRPVPERFTHAITAVEIIQFQYPEG